MKVVTIATHHNAGYERFLNSCQHFDIPVQNLGENVEFKGFGTKLMLLQRYLRQLSEDEVVLCTDAYDVVFLSDLDRIKQAYSEFHHPFVISAEQKFALTYHSIFRQWIQFYDWLTYPKGPKPYRYINAGGYMGEAGHILKILDTFQLSEETPCDQTLFQYHLIHNPESMKLDYENRIFSCNGGRSGLEGLDYEVVDNRVKNKISGTFPCLLHIPGKYDAGFNTLSSHFAFIPEIPLSAAGQKRYNKRKWRSKLTDLTLKDNFLFKFFLIHLLGFAGFVTIILALFLILRA